MQRGGSRIINKASLWLAGGSLYATTCYFSYHYWRLMKSDVSASDIPLSVMEHGQRMQQFNKIANHYDDDIGRDEQVLGIPILRRMLLFFHARGTCLEVGAGTARNLPYYRTSSNVVNRVVLSDASEQMLEQAKEKIRALPVTKRSRFATLKADATELREVFPDNSFDTVVDTFGLCSFQDPVAVLKELSRICKPTGKILLLEHGRSHSWEFITKHLDSHALEHAANWGCVWNRDLDKILEEASDALEVDVLSRYHFGTTYYIVCRPRK